MCVSDRRGTNEMRCCQLNRSLRCLADVISLAHILTLYNLNRYIQFDSKIDTLVVKLSTSISS
jgi:hypothetical protein